MGKHTWTVRWMQKVGLIFIFIFDYEPDEESRNPLKTVF